MSFGLLFRRLHMQIRGAEKKGFLAETRAEKRA